MSPIEPLQLSSVYFTDPIREYNNSPNTKRVTPLTDVCNLQDEIFMDLDGQPTCVVQPLEVIVTEHPQTTMTFNEEQISEHSHVPESESESD